MLGAISETYNPMAARILLVDDEAANLRLFCLKLRSDGHWDIRCDRTGCGLTPLFVETAPMDPSSSRFSCPN